MAKLFPPTQLEHILQQRLPLYIHVRSRCRSSVAAERSEKKVETLHAKYTDMEPFKVTLFSFCAGLCRHVNVPCINSATKTTKNPACKQMTWLLMANKRRMQRSSSSTKNVHFWLQCRPPRLTEPVPLKKGLRIYVGNVSFQHTNNGAKI